MTIQLTEEEFSTVYDALGAVNQPYTNEEVPHIVAMEAMAWEALQTVARRLRR